jgi:hypothetical protein
MINKEIRQTIICLNNKGKSSREISEMLKVSRNTVRKILRQGAELPQREFDNQNIHIIPILCELFSRCLGNGVRIHEVLKAEYNVNIPYSTLTRLIKNANLRKPAKRFGEYIFEPGVEMQHDTSPHDILIGDKKVRAQCASLVLGYSRMLFAQYYPCFTRFEAKTFLKSALLFMHGSCKRCVIDNTSVIIVSGSGADAIFSPEMNTFARMFGFEFFAHAVNNPNRKGKIERPFSYIEKNFLAGRTFQSWDDLNLQLLHWCSYSNQKEKRILGMSPERAYLQEKPYLILLPEIMPPIYEHCQRLVESSGFVNLDTNKYSAPEELIGKNLDVYKYPEEVRLFYKHKEIAIHRRLIGKRYERSCIPEHHIKHQKEKINKLANETEDALRKYHEILDQYISELKKHVRGRGCRAMNKLLYFKRTYPYDAFIKAVKRAHCYKLYDLNRLEELIIKSVAGDYFNLNEDYI